MKKALVCGAGGFIGGHMVKRLKSEGYWVRGVDIKRHEFCEPPSDDFVLGDLRDPRVVAEVVEEGMDEIYQFAADMGGFRKVCKIVQGIAVFIEPFPAALAIKTVFAEGLYRAGLNALAALPAGFQQTGFIGFHQGVLT